MIIHITLWFAGTIMDPDRAAVVAGVCIALHNSGHGGKGSMRATRGRGERKGGGGL